MKKGRIIIITGSPGTGKSTISSILAKESNMSKSVNMQTDDFYHYLSKGAIPPYLPESNEQNLIVIEAFLEAAKQRYSVYCISFHDLISQLRKAKYENRLEARIKWFCRYRLLILDELGYEKMDVDTANLFFNLIAKRYEKSSTLITTNLTFSKWPEVFGDPVLTNALLDRLLHHSQVLNINGPSYRLKDQLQLMTDDD